MTKYSKSEVQEAFERLRGWIKQQKTFGEFVSDRYGPKWVYAARATDRLRARYPDSVVITPKAQKQLRVDYQREWGREHDPQFWAMLCALRAIRDLVTGDPTPIWDLASAAIEIVERGCNSVSLPSTGSTTIKPALSTPDKGAQS